MIETAEAAGRVEVNLDGSGEEFVVECPNFTRRAGRIREGLIVVTLMIGLGLAGRPAAVAGSNPGFEQLKSLVGDWDRKAPDGVPIHLSYKLVSGGSALIETLKKEGEAEMVTVYHADGNRLAVTHYCNVNNQPQMETGPISAPASQYAFTFVRATNLASPQDGHMQGLVLVLRDKDHLTEKWTFRAAGHDQTEVLEFARKS